MEGRILDHTVPYGWEYNGSRDVEFCLLPASCVQSDPQTRSASLDSNDPSPERTLAVVCQSNRDCGSVSLSKEQKQMLSCSHNPTVSCVNVCLRSIAIAKSASLSPAFLAHPSQDVADTLRVSYDSRLIHAPEKKLRQVDALSELLKDVALCNCSPQGS